MKRSQPLQIGQIIDKMLTDTGLRPSLERRSVEALWPAVVGRHIASYTRRVALEGRVMHIYIDSAPLKEELGYLRDTLVTKLNKLANRRVVDNILIH